MDYVSLGKVINVRGLKGELKLLSLTSFGQERYKKGTKLSFYNEETNDRITFTCLTIREEGNVTYLQVQEITDCDTANKYRGYMVQYPIDQLPKLSEDTYYFYQLKGCEVEIESVGKIGIVSEIIDNPAQPILRVKTDKKDVLIPFVKYYLLKVDVENKLIVIRNIEGLV